MFDVKFVFVVPYVIVASISCYKIITRKQENRNVGHWCLTLLASVVVGISVTLIIW